MEAKDHLAIAKILYAMEKKRKQPDLGALLREERYQRTFSDEQPYVKKSRAGFVPVSTDQKDAWLRLHERSDAKANLGNHGRNGATNPGPEGQGD